MINDTELKAECAGLENRRVFPLEYTGRGENRSPELILANLSPAARTLAVTLEDLLHPVFRDFTHWIIWNIPAAPNIMGAIPPGKRVEALGNAVQGIAYGRHQYAGPKPPKGKRHRYRFTVYALDCALSLSPYSAKKKFLRAAKNHIIQKASVIGIFE